ncbi:LmbE-related protein [Bacillus sp. JCM 19047]|uniref:Bacillithiol biosynthesis deacetylase BshB1 n=1 Tax=Shouchella miscanthi TaxID=2598861 RepID=A0ABU6NFS3_9BACI|nr:bacillithiol biosynthesis deacetylase BshB1 [Shouchella miscanthi]MED4127048.1 bacillithiol biosynthesis deacetylase BshB1 [Shouchella miscanthi]GAF24199.1 LmbE-related protein [Bacillus sp. JCM 19047]
MSTYHCDLLAVGAHPDDIEIGMGGTIAKYVKEGYQCHFLTLTRAELSSNGDVYTRQKEAEAAANILGVQHRVQLNVKDRGLKSMTDEDKNELIRIIRAKKPRFIFVPLEDRHPDHGNCATIMKEAIFDAGIKNRLPGSEPHKIEACFSYFINGFAQPDFVMDVSTVYKEKMAALQAYQSQFHPKDGVLTPLTDDYLESVMARDRLFAKEVGLTYAEGFKTHRPLKMANLFER